MNDLALSTRPPSSGEALLREKFAESIAGQSELMDKLAGQLITVELAIPGLYATVLKLMSGDGATLTASPALYLTFALWFLALLLTLASLIPRKWNVNRSVMQRDPIREDDELGIEDFFHKAARYKRRLLIAASLLFFGGVLGAAFSIF